MWPPTGEDGTTRAAEAISSLGEDGQLDAELDRRPLHHPGQLAATDDTDDGEASGGALWARGSRHDAPA